MDSVDLEVLKSSAQWIEAGRRALLVTVVKTWGSSPRPEGAMLSVREDGQVVGSVSGGCIEDDLIDRVRRRGIEQTRPEAVKYGITADEAHRFGLPAEERLNLFSSHSRRKARSGTCALLSKMASWFHASLTCKPGISAFNQPMQPRALPLTRASLRRCTGRAIGCWESEQDSCRGTSAVSRLDSTIG